MAIFRAGATFSKAHHFGALQPLVFGGVSENGPGVFFETMAMLFSFSRCISKLFIKGFRSWVRDIIRAPKAELGTSKLVGKLISFTFFGIFTSFSGSRYIREFHLDFFWVFSPKTWGCFCCNLCPNCAHIYFSIDWTKEKPPNLHSLKLT